jgi:hypothetical protein
MTKLKVCAHGHALVRFNSDAVLSDDARVNNLVLNLLENGRCAKCAIVRLEILPRKVRRGLKPVA